MLTRPLADGTHVTLCSCFSLALRPIIKGLTCSSVSSMCFYAALECIIKVQSKDI